MLQNLDRWDERAPRPRGLILLRQIALVIARVAILPDLLLWTVEPKGLLGWISSSSYVDNGQDLNGDSEVYLDAHALCAVSHLIPVPRVVQKRRCDTCEDLVSTPRLPTVRPWVPEIAESDDVDIVDRIDRCVLLVRALQEARWGQRCRSTLRIFDQARNSVVLSGSDFDKGLLRVEALEERSEILGQGVVRGHS